MRHKTITFDMTVRGIIVIAATVAAVWLADALKNVLLPFVVACLVAYMLEPIVEWQQEKLKLKQRFLPVFLTLVEVGILIGAITYFFVPMIMNEIEQLDKMVRASGFKEIDTSFLPPALSDYLQQVLNFDTITDYLKSSKLMTVINKSTPVLSATAEIVIHTLEWLIAIVYVIFILLDYNHLMRGFRLAVPPKYRRKTYPVFDDIKNSMSLYFRSQALIALCAAIFYCIGFSIVKLPLAIVMGITVGILYMVPYFQYITLIPVAVLCYICSMTGDASFLPMLGKCILVYVVSQCICDYILTPKIMGKTLGLNPAIILLALSVWGTLMGIIGMIIALPVTSLIISYYKRYVLDMKTPTQDGMKTLDGNVAKSADFS